MAVRFTAISFLTLVLVASSCAMAAKTIEDLCKNNYDTGYCVTLLKPTVTKSTDFKSSAWLLEARNKAIEKATVAHNFLIDHGHNVSGSDLLDAGICDNKLRESFDMLGRNDFDSARSSQEACSDALEDASGIMRDVRVKVDEAAKASRVVNDIYTHRN